MQQAGFCIDADTLDSRIAWLCTFPRIDGDWSLVEKSNCILEFGYFSRALRRCQPGGLESVRMASESGTCSGSHVAGGVSFGNQPGRPRFVDRASRSRRSVERSAEGCAFHRFWLPMVSLREKR